MARRSSGFVQDLRDADKALSSILPKVEAFAGLLGGISAQPAGSPRSVSRGRNLSSMGGGGGSSIGLRMRGGSSSGGGGNPAGARDYRANPNVGGGGYVDVPTYLSNTTGRSAASVTAGEAEIVNVMSAVLTEIKKIRTGSDADGLRLRIGGQS